MNKASMAPHEHRTETATRIAKLDTPALRAELAKALTVTAETLSYLALVWRELESRGENLSDLRAGMGQYLPMIAAGQLAAEAVVRFAGRLSLLRAVQTLPLDRQYAIALGGPIDVATVAHDGQVVAKQLAATELTNEQIRIVFDRGRVRAIDEQENMIASARLAAKRRKRPERRYRIQVDPKKGQMQVGKMQVDVSEVLAALRLAGVLDQEAFRRAQHHATSDDADGD